jgi:hypothetical protein
VYSLFICPTEGLTWDDVCQLWDNGVYTADDMKIIAALYFAGAELAAVLKVIEKVETDSQALEAVTTDPGEYPSHPAAMIHIGGSKSLRVEDAQNLLEADCDTSSARGKSHFERAWLERTWRGLH